MPANKQNKKERRKIMKVTYAEGIKAISGSTRQKNGIRMVFTHRKTDKPGEGRMYLRGPKAYERKTPLSEQEIIARILFEKRQAYVRELMREKKLTKKDAWAIAKEVVRGPQAN